MNHPILYAFLNTYMDSDMLHKLMDIAYINQDILNIKLNINISNAAYDTSF